MLGSKAADGPALGSGAGTSRSIDPLRSLGQSASGSCPEPLLHQRTEENRQNIVFNFIKFEYPSQKLIVTHFLDVIAALILTGRKQINWKNENGGDAAAAAQTGPVWGVVMRVLYRISGKDHYISTPVQRCYCVVSARRLIYTDKQDFFFFIAFLDNSIFLYCAFYSKSCREVLQWCRRKSCGYISEQILTLICSPWWSIPNKKENGQHGSKKLM